MSDSGMKEAVITAASHLCCLLDDPQHGLASWHEACETWYRRLLEAAATEQTRALSDGAKERERMRVALERAIGLLTLGALTEAGYDQRQEWQALTGMGVPK